MPDWITWERIIWIFMFFVIGNASYKQGYIEATRNYLKGATRTMLELGHIKEEDMEGEYNKMVDALVEKEKGKKKDE